MMGDNRDNSHGQPLPGDRRRRRRARAAGQRGRPGELHRLWSTDGNAELDQAVDLVHRRALEPDRGRRFERRSAETRDWLEGLGFDGARRSPLARGADPRQHRRRARLPAARIPRRPGARPDRSPSGSTSAADGTEGKLSQRLNALVSRAACAPRSPARSACPTHMRLGKQARDDGGQDSDNILGDVMEAMLGASFLERRLRCRPATCRARLWQGECRGRRRAQPSIPRARCRNGRRAIAASRREYELVDRSGPDHAARFTVAGHGPQASARSKRPREQASRKPKPPPQEPFMETFG